MSSQSKQMKVKTGLTQFFCSCCVASVLLPAAPACAAEPGVAAPAAPPGSVDHRRHLPEWLDFSGYLQSSYRQPTRRDKPLNAVQRVWLESTVNNGGMVRAFASANLDADLAVYGRREADEDLWSSEVREAYLTLDTRHIDVIAGLQQLRWGEADSLSTFDIINPVDYRNPIATARSSQRLSVGALDLRASLGGTGLLDAVVVPRPRFSKMPDHGAPWEGTSLALLREHEQQGLADLDEEQGDSPEFASRLKFYRSGYDLAFLFYSGYEHSPRYSRDQAAASLRPHIIASYERYEAYGISTAVSFWDSTLRSELACKPHYPFQSDAIRVEQRTDYQAIVGWDRNFLTNLNINVQVFFFVYDGDAVPGKDRERYGYSWSVSDKFMDDALTAGIRGEVFANNQDYAIEFFSEYEYDDHLRFSLGMMLLGGKAENDLGQFDANDHVYVGIKYSF